MAAQSTAVQGTRVDPSTTADKQGSEGNKPSQKLVLHV